MKTYTIKNIMDIYQIKKTKGAVLKDEEKGLIPEAERVHRGSVQVRTWNESQLPKIGEMYGFLKKPYTVKVLATYSPKGVTPHLICQN